MKRSARYEAIHAGEHKYISERPCKRGHKGWRITATGTCIECRNMKSREAYAKNPRKEIDLVKKYYVANAEKIKTKRKEKYAANREKENIGAKERSAMWRKLNPDKVKAHKAIKNAYKKANQHKTVAMVAKRRAAKKFRTPSWLTSDDFWLIEEAYELAAKRKSITGFTWHVDHVIPLQGKMVSGLHVPWNLQVIPWCENVSKGNKFVADDSEARR